MDRFAKILSGVFLALLLPLMMAFAYHDGTAVNRCAALVPEVAQ